jgi:hypothetical protein
MIIFISLSNRYGVDHLPELHITQSMQLSKKLLAFYIFATVTTSLMTGCSSMNYNSMDTIAITSEPSNADVWIANDYAGKTPLEVEMSKKISHRVIISKDGYESYSVDVLPVSTEATRGTVQFGFMKDSGSYNKLIPNPVHAKLIEKY